MFLSVTKPLIVTSLAVVVKVGKELGAVNVNLLASIS